MLLIGDGLGQIIESMKHPLKLSQLEARLEGMIEGIFGGQMGVAPILRAVAHAFDDYVAANVAHMVGTPHLTVTLNPEDYATVSQAFPYFERQVAAYVVELAREMGVLLPQQPQITLTQTEAQPRHAVSVQANSSSGAGVSTERMESVEVPPEPTVRDAQLWRDGKLLMKLERHVINIGRRIDNHLVLDDPSISRQHCQLRLREGRYVIYDLNSTHGVRVNGVPIKEHILQNGDVIALGSLRLLYFEDDSTEAGRRAAGDTQIRPPVT